MSGAFLFLNVMLSLVKTGCEGERWDRSNVSVTALLAALILVFVPRHSEITTKDNSAQEATVMGFSFHYDCVY